MRPAFVFGCLFFLISFFLSFFLDSSSFLFLLYVFLETLHLHRRRSFIFGKDNRVVDILLMHPTISKQHAVLQFRKKPGDVQ